MQPTLDANRLRLVPAVYDDLDELWKLWTTAEVRRFLWDDRVIDRDEAERTLLDCVELSPRGLGLWIIELRGPGQEPGPVSSMAPSLGCAGLLPVSVAAQYAPQLSGSIEPLIALAPAAWRHGIGSDALRVLVRYAFETLSLSALAAVTDVPNTASDKMLRRAGFHPCGECSGPRHALRIYTLSSGDAGILEPFAR